tara:strand:+ start:3067 stop:3957 length:891 start_codon:yes stop_codon:yes gene_type:complete
MATVNIGSLRFDWKGAYNGSTAYVKDDVVSYNGSSYICILASTGNLPTNTTYFQPMATKGTDGTDVGTTLTTQGDILYRDGSGLQRLAAGTANQVLKTGGSGANPSWGTISSDWVKLNHTDSTSSVSNHTFQSIFDDTTYDGYKIILHTEISGNGEQVFARFMNGSSELSGGTDYRRAGVQGYRRTDNSDNTVASASDGDGRDNMDIAQWGFGSATGNAYFSELQIFGALEDTSNYKCLMNKTMHRDNSGGSGNYFALNITGYHYINYGQSIDGIKFYVTSGNFERFKCSIYGMKK